jgi:hypothetical protein
MAKGKKTGGRKKGTLNKSTEQRQKTAAELLVLGISPLEFLLSVMRDETVERDARMEAAKSAAPYMHPRLASTEISGKDDGQVQHIIEIVQFSDVADKAQVCRA